MNPNLTLLEHEPDYFPSTGITTIFKRDYSSLTVNLSLKRRIANKLAGVFTPSLLIVLITFTTYWLGPGSISDRVTIGITAFLAIIQSFASARSLLPPISYVSEIDVWMLLCMLFVAFQLLQATIVHYLYESGKLKSEAKEREEKVAQIFDSSSNKKDENQVLGRNEFLQEENLEKRKKIANRKRGAKEDDDGRVMSSTTTSTTMEAEEEEEEGEGEGEGEEEEEEKNENVVSGWSRRQEQVRRWKNYGSWNHEVEKGNRNGSDFGWNWNQEEEEGERGRNRGSEKEKRGKDEVRRKRRSKKRRREEEKAERKKKNGREIGEELIEEEDITVQDLCDPCLDLFRVTECSPNSPEFIPMKVDAFSRILVPFFFAIFCAYYWPSLLARQVDLHHDDTTGYQSSSGHGGGGHGDGGHGDGGHGGGH